MLSLSLSLSLSVCLTVCSLWVFSQGNKERIAIIILALGAFVLRLVMISLDPYLHDWDEHYHALVAKHMMDNPFKPVLRLDPVLPYNPADWCCNHIWVHKPPLFLWQMALSLKLFGITEFAVRLPSAILGALNVFLVFDFVWMWLKDRRVAFLAALLSAFSFYQLELSTGRFSVDHNDVSMTFYVTASFWAFLKVVTENRSLLSATMVGVFAGCAVLTKWLPGLMVFGAWLMFILLTPERRTNFSGYLKLSLALFVACVVFLPWQFYINHNFPVESAIAQRHNWLHVAAVLGGHTGDGFFHVSFTKTSYGVFLLPFLIIGLFRSFYDHRELKHLTISLLSVVIVVFMFFSILVKTKMPAFTYPVSSILLGFIAFGLFLSMDFVVHLTKINRIKQITFVVCIITAIYSLKPWNIIEHRSDQNLVRNEEIHNAMIYKDLPVEEIKNLIIINVKEFEDVELMFYHDLNAYHWWLTPNNLDSLQSLGIRFAAFKNHGNQYLPEYIAKDPEIYIIDKELK